MSTSDFIKELKIPKVNTKVWIDIAIGQAQFGKYTVNLFDKNGKNPQLIGNGNNIDTLPDTFEIPNVAPGLADKLNGVALVSGQH